VGWPEQGEFPYPVEPIIEKELDVHGVNRYCNTFPQAISLLSSDRIDIRPLISDRFAFKDVLEAFEYSSSNRSTTIKVMVSNES
jgi:L-iditol 2-dehydrogenase